MYLRNLELMKVGLNIPESFQGLKTLHPHEGRMNGSTAKAMTDVSIALQEDVQTAIGQNGVDPVNIPNTFK